MLIHPCLVYPTCKAQPCCRPVSPAPARSLCSRDSRDLLLLADLKLTDFLTLSFRPISFRKLSGFFGLPGGVRPHSGHLVSGQ